MFETGRPHRLLLETIWSVKKNNYTCMTVSGRLVGLGYIYQPLNHSVRWDNKPHCQQLKDDRNASRSYILNSHLQYNGWMLHLWFLTQLKAYTKYEQRNIPDADLWLCETVYPGEAASNKTAFANPEVTVIQLPE